MASHDACTCASRRCHINHKPYLCTCAGRQGVATSMEERKKAPPFPARGSHMTGLSICQTRVKYSLERRSPPTRLTGAGEAPWGTLSRGEAHLGALMRFALRIMLRWIFRQQATYYLSLPRSRISILTYLQTTFSKTFNIESGVTKWLNIFFFIKIFAFTGRALKNHHPAPFITFHFVIQRNYSLSIAFSNIHSCFSCCKL